MKVTEKGQVTIPIAIREKLEIVPFSEVEFVEEGNRVYVMKMKSSKSKHESRFRGQRGKASVKLTTKEILDLTR